ncbi:MAG TPA: amidohydrolase family protein [Solirubrobacterales bacterium]|nr:amidohydrolase family protein [Solirubrobacterales bacterium]
MTGNRGGDTTMVRGGRLVDPYGVREGDILIEDGVISAVGTVKAPANATELDASGDFVAAGLINSHYHSGENFNPGLYENLPLDLWFVHSHQVTRTEPPSPDVIYARTMLGAMLMLRAGTTSCVDFLYEAPGITLETLEPVVEAYRDAGIRATILMGVADRSFAESLPLNDDEAREWADEAETPSLDAILEIGRAAVDRWHDPDGMIGIGWGPSAPQRCSPELVEETMRMARARGLVWQTHVLETRTQVMTSREWHEGSSFVEVLGSRGLLGPETTLVHTIWLTDRDIELIAETSTTAVHCLASNLRLGDGIARLPAMRDAGVRVALGTDGRGCDETLDVLELARLTATVHKARGGDRAAWPTAAQALAMATRDASLCTGHGERLGRIEPGCRADLLVLNGASATFTPTNDVVRQLVFGGRPSDIKSVVVDGETVVQDGELTRIDEAEMLAAANQHAASEAKLLADPARRQRLERIVEGVYRRAEAYQSPVDAYVPS